MKTYRVKLDPWDKNHLLNALGQQIRNFKRRGEESPNLKYYYNQKITAYKKTREKIRVLNEKNMEE